jgi:hypothetical protein
MPETEDAGLIRLIEAFLREPLPAGTKRRRMGGITIKVQELTAGKALLALEPSRRVDAAIEVLLRLAETARTGTAAPGAYERRERLKILADRLLRGKLPVDDERMVHLAETAGKLNRYYLLNYGPVAQLVRLCEEHVERAGLDARLSAALGTIAESLEFADASDTVRQRLAAVRQGKPIRPEKEPPPVTLAPGDAWADTLLAALDPLPAGLRSAWDVLLAHCNTATVSAPARKWLDRSAELLQAIGTESFTGIAIQTLTQIGKPGSRPPRRRTYDEPTLIDEAQANLLRGLVWSCSPISGERLLAAVGQAAAACFQKITNYGPRDVKVGNACLQTLSLTQGSAAVAQLSRLRLKIKHPSALRQLDSALERVAQREGIPAHVLEEISVPTFAPDANAKEVAATLAAQRGRIERLCRSPREWSAADWRERYLDHPLVGSLARRLIWVFREGEEERTGVWSQGRMIDAAGEAFDPAPGAQVTLWHPLDVAAADVAAWRRRLQELEITQPFKQAHREIYRLTDAERETATVSNRFAAQVLKQHQLAALCAERGWRYKLQGQWDSHNLPFLDLPEHHLRIELWVEPFAEDEVSAAAIYLYVVTNQVRFYGERGALPLEDVPPRLFSELMRDVDLFVGVCNAANDPAWVEQAHRREIRYDWAGHAFGSLGATAATRREVLAGLLPKLKIADRCTLGERFLSVRGDLRTYKIHLGSGNILMEPNDQYLCIVPVSTKAKGPQAFLPYEGDGMLDVILSKAFLLVNDTKITDHLIVGQIASRP